MGRGLTFSSMKKPFEKQGIEKHCPCVQCWQKNKCHLHGIKTLSKRKGPVPGSLANNPGMGGVGPCGEHSSGLTWLTEQLNTSAETHRRRCHPALLREASWQWTVVYKGSWLPRMQKVSDRCRPSPKQVTYQTLLKLSEHCKRGREGRVKGHLDS